MKHWIIFIIPIAISIYCATQGWADVLDVFTVTLIMSMITE